MYSKNPETGQGHDEETKPMLQTTYGNIPWDDSHHPELGRWPRLAHGEEGKQERQLTETGIRQETEAQRAELSVFFLEGVMLPESARSIASTP